MDLATMKCRVVIDEAVRASLGLGVAAPGIWDGWVRMKWLELRIRATGALVESRNLSAEFLPGTNIVLLYRVGGYPTLACWACVARELTLANCFGPDK